MAETVAAVVSVGHRVLLVYPCSDQGYEGIIDEIEKVRDVPDVSVHANIPTADFLGLQRIAACLVGNSSAALIEAPYFGLPAVNVGERQHGRERARNVVDASHDRTEIAIAIGHALKDGAFRETLKHLKPPFGDGTAYQHITDVLADIPLDAKLLTKRITY